MNTTGTVIPPGSSAVLAHTAVFNTFACLGLVWLSAVLITAAASPTVHRSTAWFAQLGAWTTYSFSYVIIIGRQTGPPPPYTLCLFQTGLIYTCPPLASSAGLCFLVDVRKLAAVFIMFEIIYANISKLYLGLSAVLFKKKINPAMLNLLAIFPYMFATCVFIRVLLFVEDPATVQRHTSHLYCHSTVHTNALISAIIVIVCAFLLLCLEGAPHIFDIPNLLYVLGWIMITLYRNWKDFRHLGKNDSQYALSIFIRFGLFTTLCCFGVGLVAFTVAVGNVSFSSWSVLLPIVPIFAVLAFGTQMKNGGHFTGVDVLAAQHA
ncbi:hypothetical protein C8R43DRAFT_1236989 [Mycena crocata]|nr:hypothetical protein C8R43DRAFT_1236989 [Mycena crocata]